MSSQSLRTRYSLIPAPALAAGLMVIAACLLGAISLFVRKLAADMHPFEIAFFRNLGQLVFMLPLVIYAGVQLLKTKRIWAHARRSVFGLFAMLTWFSVITMMPLAEATAISFSAPLFTTAGAALFLREQVGVRRWVASAVGFAGVMMIIRPGVQAVGLAEILALLTAVFIAGSMLSNKSLSRTEKPVAMVTWMGIFMTAFSLPPAISVWQWPSQTETWAWIAALGLVATLAHLCLSRAYGLADASFVAPYGFAQIPFIAVMGIILYGEMPDVWTWCGGAVIISSGVYIARREAKLAKAKAAKAVYVQTGTTPL